MDGVRGVDGWSSWCGRMASTDQRRCHRLARTGDGIQHALNDVASEAIPGFTTINHSEYEDTSFVIGQGPADTGASEAGR